MKPQTPAFKLQRIFLILLPLVFLSCDGPAEERNRQPILLATTTSLQDSGLLDILVPLFEKRTGYRVKTIAAGTGQALAMGARGDADLILVHAPELEERYMAQGSFINRRPVMHNDFLIVGPPDDPARVKGLKKATLALRRIAKAKTCFVSRGDNSGTHFLERKLWKEAGIEPAGPWYLQSGQGMGATLMLAAQKGGYTLSDRGTFLAFSRRIRLVRLVEGDPRLLNPYHVMEVNPERFPKVNPRGARAFADFLLSPEAQEIIRTFGVERYGEPLFFPDAENGRQGLGR